MGGSERVGEGGRRDYGGGVERKLGGGREGEVGGGRGRRGWGRDVEGWGAAEEVREARDRDGGAGQSLLKERPIGKEMKNLGHQGPFFGATATATGHPHLIEHGLPQDGEFGLPGERMRSGAIVGGGRQPPSLHLHLLILILVPSRMTPVTAAATVVVVASIGSPGLGGEKRGSEREVAP